MRQGDRFCAYCGTDSASLEAARAEMNPVQHIHVHNHYYEQEMPEPQVMEKVVYVQEQPARSPKNRVVLLLLYFFLGYLGIHKFYARRMGWGFLYLFTAGLGGIGLCYDFFSILFGTPRDGDGLPIRW